MAITRANPGSAPVTVAVENLSLQDVFVYDALGIGTIRIQIQGTWVGTLFFETQIGDNSETVWDPLAVVPIAQIQAGDPIVGVFSTTINGQFTTPVTGYNLIRVCANLSSGFAHVSMIGAPGTAIVAISNFPAAGAGGLTDAQLRATPVPVSGTFFQATQPVSLASVPSHPVTGTFFQATQPVSLAVAPTTPVTGTFFQATQPVSVAALPLPAGASTETTLAALNAKVTAVNTGAVVVTSAPTTAVTNAGLTNLDAALSTRLKPADTLTAVTTVGTITNPVAVTSTGLTNLDVALSTRLKPADTLAAVTAVTSITNPVTVTPPTLTKGTQGTTGFSTQALNDAGRNQTNFFHAVPIITTTAEVMQTLTGYKSGAAVAATATPAVVTAGKTYRITSIDITYWAATVIGGARINLRANLSGVAVVGSPLVRSWQVGIPAIFTAGSANTYVFTFPDGIEFAAGTGIAVGVIGEGATPTTGTITGFVMVAIQGYEY